MASVITTALLLSIVPFSFSLLLDICLGKPADQENFDRKAIFFSYSLFLAKMRLIRNGNYKGIKETYITNMNSKDHVIKHAAKMEFKKVVFETGREFFSWELGFGMCPYCTNARIALFGALVYAEFFGGNWFFVLLIPCFSNLYLLFLNKLKS